MTKRTTNIKDIDGNTIMVGDTVVNMKTSGPDYYYRVFTDGKIFCLLHIGQPTEFVVLSENIGKDYRIIDEDICIKYIPMIHLNCEMFQGG